MRNYLIGKRNFKQLTWTKSTYKKNYSLEKYQIIEMEIIQSYQRKITVGKNCGLWLGKI